MTHRKEPLTHKGTKHIVVCFAARRKVLFSHIGKVILTPTLTHARSLSFHFVTLPFTKRTVLFGCKNNFHCSHPQTHLGP